MGRRNNPLLISLSIYLAILAFIISRDLVYIGLMDWLKYNGWTLIVATLIPILAIVAEFSGVFKGKPQKFVASFIVLTSILLAADYVEMGTYNSASFMFLLSIILMLIYILAMKSFFPSGGAFHYSNCHWIHLLHALLYGRHVIFIKLHLARGMGDHNGRRFLSPRPLEG
jgi:hypothetical protein